MITLLEMQNKPGKREWQLGKCQTIISSSLNLRINLKYQLMGLFKYLRWATNFSKETE